MAFIVYHNLIITIYSFAVIYIFVWFFFIFVYSLLFAVAALSYVTPEFFVKS